jgi:cellulase/cellobiase CelA1
MNGIKYTVNAFAKDTDASIYLDAGHGGWLGWANPDDDKPMKFATLIKEMGIGPLMRGYATNVANYQPVGKHRCKLEGEMGGCPRNKPMECCKEDPCGYVSTWNWGHTEINYVDVLADRSEKANPGWKPQFIVDTGRNGKPDARQECANWCNPRDNGIGWVPMAGADTNHERIDAFYWLKTPGESDGCTSELPQGGKCPRFDEMCESSDSIGSKPSEPRSPEAGLWFDYQIKQLAENADLGNEWWQKTYQKGMQCRGDDGGCAEPMPTPTTTTTTLGPGKCSGNHGGCSSASNRASCFAVSSDCKWTGCCGGGGCASKNHNGWNCKNHGSAGACNGDQNCRWEEDP